MPCLKWEYCELTATSWNNIVNWMSNFENENKLLNSNVIVLISTNYYQPPELKIGEILAKPNSPIHVFQIIIGKTTNKLMFRKFQFAATTAHLIVTDFDSLFQLVNPLCESVQSFLGNNLFIFNKFFVKNYSYKCIKKNLNNIIL